MLGNQIRDNFALVFTNVHQVLLLPPILVNGREDLLGGSPQLINIIPPVNVM